MITVRWECQVRCCEEVLFALIPQDEKALRCFWQGRLLQGLPTEALPNWPFLYLCSTQCFQKCAHGRASVALLPLVVKSLTMLPALL